MESLENHLIDKENGVIKLLDPPFDKGILKPGYISSYVPGTREMVDNTHMVQYGLLLHLVCWALEIKQGNIIE